MDNDFSLHPLQDDSLLPGEVRFAVPPGVLATWTDGDGAETSGELESVCFRLGGVVEYKLRTVESG